MNSWPKWFAAVIAIMLALPWLLKVLSVASVWIDHYYRWVVAL